MKQITPLFLLLLLLCSCKKEITELPPATETGAQTFGAKVNGSFWVPQGFAGLGAGNKLEARMMPNNDFYINARNFASSPNETEFQLFLKGVTAPGVYLFNTDVGHPSTSASYAYYVKRNLTPQNEWVTSSQYSGAVTVTKVDMVNRIVSGTFQFEAINLYNSPQPITVTEGRFDVKWQ